MTRTNAELTLLKRVGYFRSSLRYLSEPLNLSSVDIQANPNTVCCSPILAFRDNQNYSMGCDVRTLNVRGWLNSAYHRVWFARANFVGSNSAQP